MHSQQHGGGRIRGRHSTNYKTRYLSACQKPNAGAPSSALIPLLRSSKTLIPGDDIFVLFKRRATESESSLSQLLRGFNGSNWGREEEEPSLPCSRVMLTTPPWNRRKKRKCRFCGDHPCRSASPSPRLIHDTISIKVCCMNALVLFRMAICFWSIDQRADRSSESC